MSYTNGLDKPDEYFNTVLYTGNGSTQSISGIGFQPDWIAIKRRNAASGTQNMDLVRGAANKLAWNETSAEESPGNILSSFDSDGFTVGNSAAVNGSSDTFVAWNWKANGAGVSNTDGSITSTVSANTTSGFSIVSYTGNSSSATVGHGLGVAPKFIIIKHRNDVDDWTCYHVSLGASQRIQLNSTGSASSLSWGGSPTSSVFYLLGGGATAVNVTGGTYIAYCFAEIKGYSKFGSFNGNGNADGTFVYTGFKPAFIITKITSETGSWFLHDNKRNGYNGANNYVYPNASDAELTTQLLDITSNGFKMRFAGGANSSGTSIYMAFAESPFTTSTGIPTTAR